MSLESSIDKLGDWFNNNKTVIMIVLGIFVFLAFTGKIPPTVEVSSQSVFGGWVGPSLALGPVLIMVGIGMVSSGVLILPGAALIAGGFGLTISAGLSFINSIVDLLSTSVGIVLAVIVGMVLYIYLIKRR